MDDVLVLLQTPFIMITSAAPNSSSQAAPGRSQNNHTQNLGSALWPRPRLSALQASASRLSQSARPFGSRLCATALHSRTSSTEQHLQSFGWALRASSPLPVYASAHRPASSLPRHLGPRLSKVLHVRPGRSRFFSNNAYKRRLERRDCTRP